MRIRVLGSGAGGGFPQWNCNCPNCDGVRRGAIPARPRTQSSIGLSADGVTWVLVNASPDVRAQLAAFPPMQPGRAVRDTAICGIVLIDSQIDHTTGLLMLREGGPLHIYCTGPVHEDLTTGNPLLRVLAHYGGTTWHPIPLAGDGAFTIEGAESLRFTAVPLTSKAPPYSPHRHDSHPGDTIGLRVEDPATGGVLFYAPGLGEIGEGVRRLMVESDCVMVDGTFWTEDEMARLGIADRRARELGHIPQSGPGGMLEILAPLGRPRKILIHINNTNPILNEASPERRQLAAAGIEVSWDGMDIRL
ncbi:MAG: pyrroloquinoline quinone biosynthesis protein PqqB [Candidatus Rokubacteria bacterium]|nr:pyrroloquinoline quinone biosynthesis protein PqqB [Candidatus Rokubacteria bacterium]